MGKLSPKLGTRVALATIFSLIFSVLLGPSPATAVVAACDGSSTQSSLKVTALHGQVIYVDTGTNPRLDAAYVSYRVTNTAATSKENLWVELSGFVGGVAALANPADKYSQIESISASSSKTSFFLLKASTPTTTDQTHTVKVYDDRPDLGGTVLYTCAYTFTDVKDTIKAKSNRVVSVSSSNTTPVLGELLSVTVEGKTGQVGQGESPDGDIMWFSPSAYSSWPTRALRLESTSVLLDSDGSFSSTSDQRTYSDQLIITGVQSLTLGAPANKIGSSSRYRATYNYRVIGSAPTGTKVVPVAQISSGRRIKHTDTAATDTGAFPTLDFSRVDNTVTIDKTATVISPDSPTGYSTIEYTINVTTTSQSELLIDEIVDQPDAGIQIVSGSASFTDYRRGTSTSISDPLADAQSKYHFVGPFYLTGTQGMQLIYRALIPRTVTQATYTNYAYGLVGDRIVGRSNASIDGIVITSGPGGPSITDTTKSIGATITTLAASSVTTNNATMNGLIDPNENFTAFGFQYSLNSNMSNSTCVQTAGAASQSNSINEVSYAYSLTGLSAATTYYFRAVANSDSAVSVSNACTSPTLIGDTFSFTTTPQGLTSQTITWNTTFSNLTTNTPTTVTTAATASSTLPVTLTSTDESVCVVTDQPDPDNATAGYALITIVGPGTCTLTATQSGNATYSAATSITKSFTVSGVNLGITISGSGSVTSDVGGVNCAASCTKSIRTNEVVTLTATPQTGYSFTGWSGSGCSGTSTCAVTMSASKSVTATFEPTSYLLTLDIVGNGSVSATGITLNCSSDCTSSITHGDAIVLTATSSGAWDFIGWSGDCSGTSTCSISVSANVNVTATFERRSARVDVTTVGNGRVQNNYNAPNCRGNCSIDALEDDTITLTAVADTGWQFTGWTGACTGSSSTCVISLTRQNPAGIKSTTASLSQIIKSTNATFTITQETLTASVTGSGSVSDGANLNCGVDCSSTYDYGTAVTLTATPASGWYLSEWTGACTGTGDCVVTMDAAKSVTAVFLQIPVGSFLLSVGMVGSGQITGTGGLDCLESCSQLFSDGTSVTLTATAASGWVFAGWSGACSGTGTCSVTMSAAKSVTATFTRIMHDLDISVSGSGSVGGDFTCASGTCTESVGEGDVVTLTATPASGWQFAGWSGACTGTGTCSVTMSAAKNVTATFTRIMHELTVTIVGEGTVRDNDLNSCSTTCVLLHYEGEEIHLTATAASGWEFVEWSQDCTDLGICSITLFANGQVTATFQESTDIQTIELAVVGDGFITGDISCDSECTELVEPGTEILLVANPQSGWVFTGWSGACIGTADCYITIGGSEWVTAHFSPVILNAEKQLQLTIIGAGQVGLSNDSVCTDECTYVFAENEEVSLTAAAETSWLFAGYSDFCNTNNCNILMTEDVSLTVKFSPIAPKAKATVTLTGTLITWKVPASQAGQTIQYNITSDGELVCQSTTSKCKFKGFLGPIHEIGIYTTFAGEDSEVQIVQLIQKIKLVTIYFKYDSFKQHTLIPVFVKRVTLIAKELKAAGYKNFMLSGHTDSKGSKKFNIKLSKNRVLEIKRIIKKIRQLTVKAKWFGETSPAKSNKTGKGRKLNRRVEILVSW